MKYVLPKILDFKKIIEPKVSVTRSFGSAIYKEFNMKNLSLSPTRSPGVSQVCLSDGYSQRIIGSYNEASKTFTAFRSEAKHLFKNTNSLGINEAVLNELPVRWVEILYTGSSGRVQSLITSKDFLMRFGTRAAYASTGYEAQVFLKLDAFGMDRAIRYQSEINSQQSFRFA